MSDGGTLPDGAPSRDQAGGEGAAQDFEIVSLFPEMFDSFLSTALLGKAVSTGLLRVFRTNPRDFAPGRHRSVDDAPYGGGSGMVMRPEVIVSALEHLEGQRGPAHKVLLTPVAPRLDQARVRALAERPRIALVCGRYEGFDERVADFIDERVSIGDFILSGGETAAMIVMDAVARLRAGVLGNRESLGDESFETGLLEYPQYTRPPEWRGRAVPEALLSGDHERIRRWRRLQSMLRTRAHRPDLWARHPLGDEDRVILRQHERDSTRSSARTDDARARLAARTFVALVHHPVRDRAGATITTTITNLDVHDLARACRTYELGGLYLTTPIEAQRDLAARILGAWASQDPEADDGSRRASRRDHRAEALSRVVVVESVDAACADLERRFGHPPLLVGSSAREEDKGTPRGERIDAESLAEVLAERAARGLPSDERPVLLLVGTGYGLANQIGDRVDLSLPPIRGGGSYNHLSVRSATAILLDRLFGLRSH